MAWGTYYIVLCFWDDLQKSKVLAKIVRETTIDF